VSDGDQALNFIYLLAMLVLLGSAFAVRRVPLGQSLKMFLAWMLIFLAAFVAFTLRDDFAALGKRMLAEVRGESGVEQRGETMRIRQDPDGHFWADAQVNGQTVRFLVDSGATTTSISSKTARMAGIEPSSPFPAIVQTANGTVAVQRGRAERIVLGSIERNDVSVHIFEGAGDMNVLGMNFLSSLSSWGVQDRWLVLEP
jgi:aspartyl protease family protein